VLPHVVHQPASIQLRDAVSDEARIGWEPDRVGQSLREVLDRSRAVGELEDRGRGAIEAVRLLAREIVDDQLVGDLFEQHVGTASPGIRSRHDASEAGTRARGRLARRFAGPNAKPRSR
jgi:hypothetical protein